MDLLIVLLFFNFFVCINSSQCNTFKTCGECIGHASERCVWCAQDKVMDVRCQPNAIKNETWCIKNFIQDPHSTIKYEVNEDFSSNIQFRPQKLTLKLRPGLPLNFTMAYKPAVDFPLDLYFVMDFSYTMRDHKEQLKSQAIAVYEALKKLTKNVLLGVGSFIEKPGFPYSNYKNSISYAFKNQLSLTNNMTIFEELITSLNQFGGNLEDPEAGLDALMQAMVCEKEIGWRSGSRRIIVLATDQTYHSAGDGKMIGAYKPYDMKCYLRNNEYMRNESLIYDYPSVSQINTVATNGNFKVIFAALNKVKEEYTALANQILNAKYAELQEKSNIMDIIQRAYKESVKSVRLDYVLPKFIELKIDQNCDSLPKINCESIPSRLEVRIPASIKVTNCTSEGSNQKKIWIKPVGITDSLTIHLEIDCTCPCEQIAGKITEECSSAGFKQCGVCKCNQNSGGDKCQYDCTDENAKLLSSNCKHDPGDKDLCSKHGSCRCGKCTHCDEGFSGQYCQYSEDQCPQPKGKRCSNNGKCIEGRCVCYSGWTGEACSCPDNNLDCISPFSSRVCSGRGYCDCGECKCNRVPHKNENYTGVFCHECEECAKEVCDDLKPYAHCNFFHEQLYCDKKYNQTKHINVDKTESIDSTKWGLGNKCEVAIEDGKLLTFKYKFIGGRLYLLIKKDLDETPKANLWLAAGLSVGTVVLIGIITGIIWKILIDLYDKREYEKFCNEAKTDGFDVSENPLYQDPLANFHNPAYNSE